MTYISHEGKQVQRLLWAVGQARRLRLAGIEEDAPSAARERAGAKSADADAVLDIRFNPGSGGLESHPFDMSVADHGRRAYMRVEGTLDRSTARRFSERVRDLVERGARSIVVDLGGADVVGAYGVRALADSLRHVEAHRGELLLRYPSCSTLQLLALSGLDDVITVC